MKILLGMQYTGVNRFVFIHNLMTFLSMHIPWNGFKFAKAKYFGIPTKVV